MAGAEPLQSGPGDPPDPLERRGSQQPSAESRGASYAAAPSQATAARAGAKGGVTTRGRAMRRAYAESDFESGGAAVGEDEEDDEAASEDRHLYQEVL